MSKKGFTLKKKIMLLCFLLLIIPNWSIALIVYFMNEGVETQSEITMTLNLFLIPVLIIGLLVANFFSGRITKSIEMISIETSKLAAGDFTSKNLEIYTTDEVGKLASDFNKMKKNIHHLIYDVYHSTEQVAASSEELSASAEETSKTTKDITQAVHRIAIGAESSNVNLLESSQSLEEVTHAIGHLAENAAIIAKNGTSVIEKANQGAVYVEETVNQMKFINQRVIESNEVLQLLDQSSAEIGQISATINNIADQTNLLALNAAIEAARAGEHGKGFAVVADEVRKLAEQVQASSQQISILIADIQANMSRSTDSMNKVREETEEGLQIIKQTEVSFTEIAHSMTDLGMKISEMATTVEQMSASAEEVSATVSNTTNNTNEVAKYSQEIANNSQEQLASMEEITSSANSLSKLAEALQQQVGKFKI